MCRICHEGDEEEELVSPCHCAGTMGMLHISCLEQWLGSSKTTKCEICQFQFSVLKKPQSMNWVGKLVDKSNNSAVSLNKKDCK